MNVKMIVLLAAILTVCSCKKEFKEKEYFSISGKISNHTKDSLYFFNFSRNNKVIRINTDGTFLDTIHIKEPGMAFINHETGQYRIFARNGYDVHLSWEAKNLPKTLKVTGHGNEVLNFFKNDFYDSISDFFKNREHYFKLSKADFKKKCEKNVTERLNGLPKNDSVFATYYKNFLNDMLESDLVEYDDKQYFSSVLAKGMESPKFVNYENYSGGTTSLDDFSGKYVYIDVWATWCKPCKREIPHLEKLEEKYHGKNIEFLSISVDDERNYDKWKQMVVDKDMKGIQLLADKSAESDFMRAYKVDGIPRMILIDPKGNIVSNNAPLPSEDESIASLFSELDL